MGLRASTTDAPFGRLERRTATRSLFSSGSGPATIAAMLFLVGCTGSRSNVVDRVPSLRVADAALVAGAPEVALRVADLTLQRDPRNAEALVTKGDTLYAMGLREEARTAYRQAVNLDPTLAAAQLGLGRTLVQSDPAAAETAFLAAVASRPDDSAALNNVGIARDLLGRHAEAQEAYRRALAIAPGAADVKVNLGLSLALTGNKSAAVEILHEAAAAPETIRGRGKELAAALALAGDAVGAHQLATAGSPQAAMPSIASAEIPRPPIVAGREEAVAAKPKQDKPVAARLLTPSERDDPDVLSGITKAPVAAVGRANLGPLPSDTPEALVGMAQLQVPKARKGPVTADAPQPNSKLALPAPETGAFVQLASLHSLDDARYEWQRLTRRFSDLLSGHTPVIVQADALGQTYWCLRTFGFTDLDGATAMCSAAHEASGLRCWARVAS
jgi:Flp pilus assembly protein TadD